MTSGTAYRATIETGDRSLLATYRDTRTALCDEGPCAAITYRPEWVDCFLDAYHPDPTLDILVVRAGNAVRGLLPLIVLRYGIGPLALRRAILTANYHTWDFDLIHGACDREEVITAASDALRQWRGFDLLQVASTPDTGAIAAIRSRWPGTVSRREERSYLIPCPPPGSTLAATIDHSYRSRKTQIKRHLRKLEARHDLARRRIDPTTGAEALVSAAERHVALELAGWKGSGEQVDIADRRLQDYYRILAERGLLTVHEIWIGDDLVASHLGVIDGHRMMTLRFSYDARYADVGPGNMVLLWVVQDAGDRGCRTVDLGGTGVDSPTYKAIWTDRTYGVDQCGVYGTHARGRLAAFMLQSALPGATRIWQQRVALPNRLRDRIPPASSPAHRLQGRSDVA